MTCTPSTSACWTCERATKRETKRSPGPYRKGPAKQKACAQPVQGTRRRSAANARPQTMEASTTAAAYEEWPELADAEVEAQLLSEWLAREAAAEPLFAPAAVDDGPSSSASPSSSCLPGTGACASASREWWCRPRPHPSATGFAERGEGVEKGKASPSPPRLLFFSLCPLSVCEVRAPACVCVCVCVE